MKFIFDINNQAHENFFKSISKKYVYQKNIQPNTDIAIHLYNKKTYIDVYDEKGLIQIENGSLLEICCSNESVERQ
jgi:hypothetical protein